MEECSYELLPAICLLFTRCDVENILSLAASVWPFVFFFCATNFFKQCAATVFPNIFINFDSGRKLKSTLFECALYELPNAIGLLFLAVSSKTAFRVFLVSS